MRYTTQDVQAFLNEIEANKAQMDALNERNKQIRIALATEALGEAWGDASGTQNVELHGVKLKFVFKQNYSVKAKELPAIMDRLSEDGRKAFKYKPELSLTAYRDLSPADKALVNSVVTSTPALPTIEKK